MKVNILEEFNTSFGKTLIVKNENKITIGDTIEDEQGKKYKVKQIRMSNNPDFLNTLAIVV